MTTKDLVACAKCDCTTAPTARAFCPNCGHASKDHFMPEVGLESGPSSGGEVSQPVPAKSERRVLITASVVSVVVLVASGLAGWKVGASRAPSPADAVRVENVAREKASEVAYSKAFDDAYEKSYEPAYKEGHRSGVQAGRKAGKKAGTKAGTAAGKREGERSA